MKKIMVVDDEKDLLALTKISLKRAGCEVAVTSSCDADSFLKKPFRPSELEYGPS
jgi:DNA-binding NtrC family response regulator